MQGALLVQKSQSRVVPVPFPEPTRPSVMEVSPYTFGLSKSILLIDRRVAGGHRIAGDHRINGDRRVAGIIE